MKGIIVVGSNFGDRVSNIHEALSFIKTKCLVVNSSDIYETPDILGAGCPYMNIVIEIETDFEENILNKYFKTFEVKAGRNDLRRRRGEVPIDIDIVIWGDSIRRNQDFQAKYFLLGYSQFQFKDKVKAPVR